MLISSVPSAPLEAEEKYRYNLLSRHDLLVFIKSRVGRNSYQIGEKLMYVHDLLLKFKYT